MSMPVITHSQTSRCQAITDIIESVALEQTALSHILNAEGEKIQKAVSRCDVNTDKLLDINQSVRRTINAISRLELILQGKLELFEDCLCDNCRRHHDDD